MNEGRRSLADAILRETPAAMGGVDAVRIGLAVGVFVLLAAILSVDLVPVRFLGVRVGQPSVRTIVAPTSVRVTDTFATRARREAAAASVPPQHRFDPNALTRVVGTVDGFFAIAAELAGQQDVPLAERVKRLRAGAPRGVSLAAVKAALKMTPAKLDSVSLETRRLASLLLVGTVTQDDLDRVRIALSSTVAALQLPVAERLLIEDVGQAALAPTYVADAQKRAELARDAASAVAPVELSRQKGEVVVRQGEIVTREHLLLLRTLGLTQSRVDFSRVAGVSLLVMVMMSSVLVYLARMEPWVFASNRLMSILGIVIVGVAVAAKIAFAINASVAVTAVPVAVAPMLATLLINPPVGLVAAVASTVVLAMATQFSAEAMMWSLFACIFAVYAASNVTTRSGFYRAGAVVTLSSGAVGAAVWLFAGAPWREAATAGLLGLGGGVLATVLTIGSLPFYESVFKITTDLKLADLVNPEQPLLREMSRNAPGTYNHSVVTGSLAEAAAESIGANAMLARAGAYYHDIGKTRRPSFFVENQIGGMANPHDHTNPRLSSLVIAAHVKEGVELAQKAGLPKEVIDAINQHHGTSVVSYFYQRAVEQEGYQSVLEDDFRYEGAKPQSREAAIVMLADGLEAMVRSLAKPTPQRIEAAARKIVQIRADDGQLDESRLTMYDLDVIVRAFTQVLGGMHHARVEYPEPAHLAQPKKVARGGSDG